MGGKAEYIVDILSCIKSCDVTSLDSIKVEDFGLQIVNIMLQELQTSCTNDEWGVHVISGDDFRTYAGPARILKYNTLNLLRTISSRQTERIKSTVTSP